MLSSPVMNSIRPPTMRNNVLNLSLWILRVKDITLREAARSWLLYLTSKLHSLP